MATIGRKRKGMDSSSSTSHEDKKIYKSGDVINKRRREQNDDDNESHDAEVSSTSELRASSSSPSTANRDHLSGQVCRIWLKHRYLGIGASCDNLCQRKHLVTGKPESLYQDFAFKGLRKNHQHTILRAIRDERKQSENKSDGGS